MEKAMASARKAARRAQEAAYGGLCTIVEYGDITDGKTKLTVQGETSVVENQPCRLSFEKLEAARQTGTAAVVTQGIKLFLAPEIEVKGNSKIIVTQNGVTGEYSASGIPAIYPTHQEIVLETFRGWA